MKAAQLLVECLQNEGTEYVFGVPGEENLDLLEALSNSSIRFVAVRHEQAAGFMAATLGRLTGTPGVCLSTLGPGAANLATAAAYAQLGSFPLILITAQKPVQGNDQAQFQAVDVGSMFAPVTKLTLTVGDADHIPALVRRSFATAAAPRKGAVHLELPEDTAGTDTESRPLPIPRDEPVVAASSAISDAARLIAEASVPLVLCGASAVDGSNSEALTEFVSRHSLACISTQMGKGAVSDRSTQILGTAVRSAGDPIHQAFQASDLIISVGYDPTEKPPFLIEACGGEEPAAFRESPDAERRPVRILHIGESTLHPDQHFFPHFSLRGNIAANLKLLSEYLGDFSSSPNPELSDVGQTVSGLRLADAADERFPLHPSRLVADIRQAVPEDGIMTLDNGMYKLWFARNFEALHPHSLILDNALATMGAGLPSAIAAALTFPNRAVVAVCGDGGYMMNSQELETAVRLRLNLVVVLPTDNGLGMIRWKQQSEGYDEFGTTFCNPDFVRHAESFGAAGRRVMSAAELRPAVSSALAAGGVHVIEVPIDYSVNEEVFGR